ncbi:MAG: NADH-quinone oxidoreductase subunit I [Coriobacteriia bacterium]|nr:NADH-quinone oxidoreductase subunit I [Coriobacteriia bacterium]
MSIWGIGILNGLRITMKNMLRGPITVKYPHEKIELPERARWAVQLKLDEDGAHKCTACMACERACPDHIIKIDVTTGEDRSKHIDRWGYELGACMMCGLCVESCSFDAVEMGHDYELATVNVEDLVTALLVDAPAAKPKRKAAAERPAAPAEPAAPAAPVEPAAPTEPADAKEVDGD